MKFGIVWLVGLAMLGGVVPQNPPASGQSSSGELWGDPLSASSARELCDALKLADLGFLRPQVRAELAQCAHPAGRQERAACEVLRGLRLLADGDKDAAREIFHTALALYERADDPWGAWTVHFLLGVAAITAGEGRTAESHLRQALDLLEVLERSKEPISARSLGLLGRIAGVPDPLLQLLEAMPEVVTPDLVQFAVPWTHFFLGVILGCEEQFHQAERHLREALTRFGSQPEIFDASLIHEQLGWLQQLQGHPDSALESYQQALKAARFRGDTQRALSVAERLSQAYGTVRRFEEVERVNEEALEIAGSDPVKQSWLWSERALLHARAGRMAEARRAIAAARAMAEVAHVPFLEEQVLLETGMGLFELELFEDAASSLEEAVKLLSRQVLDENMRLALEIAHMILAEAYGRLGLDDLQRTEMAELERLVEDSGHIELLRIAEFMLANKDGAIESGPDQSPEALRRLLETMRNSEFPSLREGVHQIVPLLEGIEPLLEIEDVAEVDELLQQDDTPEIARRFLAPLAPILRDLQDGHYDEVSHAFDGVMQQMEAVSDLPRLQKAQALMALALFDGVLRDQPGEAVARCREAIDLFESFVDEMRLDETITGVVDRAGHVLYRQAVKILARVSPEEAFSYAERGRAWTLRRLLGSPRRSDPELGPREQEALAKISAVEHDQSAELRPGEKEELDSRREAYEMLRLRSKLTSGKDAGLAPVDPVTLDQLRGEILDPESTLLAYFPEFEEPGLPHLWVWAIDRNGIEMASIPMPGEEWNHLACQIQALRWQGSPPAARRLAQARGARLLSGCGDEDDPGAALYRRLIAPLAPHLRQQHLIVVPYGVLHHLPFAALRNPDTGRYLVQEFTLSLAPSASALALLSRRPGSVEGKALVLGDPVTRLARLTGARQEAQGVARLIGGTPFLGKMATESRVYANAGRIRLLHLAAHAQYMPQTPRFSRVLLTADSEHDGALEMHEVWDRLDLRGAELVVLSGCQTALGEITRGDEVIGLTHAFLVAGSQAVISTLWPVDDVASAQLMEGFYANYLRKDMSAAEALQAAQLEMLDQSSTAAPYYWAGYTLTGAPHSRWHPATAGRSLASAESPDPPNTIPPSDVKAESTAKIDPGTKAGSEAKSPETRRGMQSGTAAQPSFRFGKSRGDSGGGAPATPPGSAQTPGERRADLDRRLEDSLARFDGMLLREKEMLAAQRSGSGRAASGGAGETGEVTKGGALVDHGEATRPTAEQVGEALRNGRIPPDIPDGSDDDIVARQLREAAMDEDNPELREKLWEEYRRYKGIGNVRKTTEGAAEEEGEQGGHPGGRLQEGGRR